MKALGKASSFGTKIFKAIDDDGGVEGGKAVQPAVAGGCVHKDYGLGVPPNRGAIDEDDVHMDLVEVSVVLLDILARGGFLNGCHTPKGFGKFTGVLEGGALGRRYDVTLVAEAFATEEAKNIEGIECRAVVARCWGITGWAWRNSGDIVMDVDQVNLREREQAGDLM